MKLGEKIRELRVSKLMTQADLAGDAVTRNMLSCIENNSAMPSLSTLLYIAKRLNVPVGYLLADEGDESVYRKMNSFSNIKRAYIAGDLRGCRSLCISGCPQPDDEISLLLACCDTGIAVEEFQDGRLRFACRFFDEALSYAEKTMYPTAELKATARVYFRYMERISPTLSSDALDMEASPFVECNLPLAHYLDALDALETGDTSLAEAFCEKEDEQTFFCKHLQIRRSMLEGDYSYSERALLQWLETEEPFSKVYLYMVLCDLEICCRESEDFKGAYQYANQKIELLEQLLRDF